MILQGNDWRWSGGIAGFSVGGTLSHDSRPKRGDPGSSVVNPDHLTTLSKRRHVRQITWNRFQILVHDAA
jgi:hypothetical protein